MSSKESVTVRIVQSDCPENPREAWEGFGVMACWHDRYSLGDVQPSEDLQEWLSENAPHGSVVISLYLYDHSGITMNTSGFACRWDSGQVGVIVATPKAIKEAFMVDAITDDVVERVVDLLKAEVAVYDHYLTGNVWGYVIERPANVCECCGRGDGMEEIDSCFGFYGDDDALDQMLDHVEPEHHEALREAWEARFSGRTA